MTQTTIAAGSDGAALPQAIVNVASTAGFAAAPGRARILSSTGLALVSYAGLTATSFTGCTGGTGTMSLGGVVYPAHLDDTARNFGALDLPVPATNPASTTIGDPCLDTLLAFLKAVLNADAAATWATIAATQAGATGATSPVVLTTHTHDPGGPEGVAFRTQDLPALYLSRDGSDEDAVRIADDFLVSKDRLTLLWVFPLRTQPKHVIRNSYVNALVKIITSALAAGRHPAWIQAGDPEPQASYNGSFVWNLAGIWKIGVGRWRTRPVEIGDGGEKARYSALEVSIHLEERERRAPGFGLQEITVTGQTADSPPFVTDSVLLATP